MPPGKYGFGTGGMMVVGGGGTLTGIDNTSVTTKSVHGLSCPLANYNILIFIEARPTFEIHLRALLQLENCKPRLSNGTLFYMYMYLSLKSLI